MAVTTLIRARFSSKASIRASKRPETHGKLQGQLLPCIAGSDIACRRIFLGLEVGYTVTEINF
jgi:hypothetical protein